MQEIQLQSWRDPRNLSRPYVSYSIRCVRLDALRERLRTSTEKQVLSLLSRKDNPLLATVLTAAVKCVFVSYRQEIGTQDVADAPYDEFTLDGNALRGIIAAATRLGAEAMWLDCWCYLLESMTTRPFAARSMTSSVAFMASCGCHAQRAAA